MTYIVRKLQGVATRGGGEVAPAREPGMDAVHTLVGTVLGDDPALAALERQAPRGEVPERTVRRVTDAIADAADSDPAFADRLIRLVRELQARDDGPVTASGERSVAIGRDNTGIIVTGDGATIEQSRPT